MTYATVTDTMRGIALFYSLYGYFETEVDVLKEDVYIGSGKIKGGVNQ